MKRTATVAGIKSTGEVAKLFTTRPLQFLHSRKSLNKEHLDRAASPEPTIDSSDSDVTSLAQRLHDCFSLIQDHRSTISLLHQLSDILTISVLAVIAGGNGWEDMARRWLE